MPIWEQNSQEYLEYLRGCTDSIVDKTIAAKAIPDTKMIEGWHRQIYSKVASDSSIVGKIRTNQKPHLNKTAVVIRENAPSLPGFLPAMVPGAMTQFSNKLKSQVSSLDASIESLSPANQLRQIAKLVAWAHGAFVRIHPFCDGNGRMARLLANCLLRWYGISYSFSIRPRPMGSYSDCACASMKGEDGLMEQYLLREIVAYQPSA